jgi:hypothetical protein
LWAVTTLAAKAARERIAVLVGKLDEPDLEALVPLLERMVDDASYVAEANVRAAEDRAIVAEVDQIRKVGFGHVTFEIHEFRVVKVIRAVETRPSPQKPSSG